LLFEKYKVRSLRLTLSEISARATRDENTGALFIDGTREIALVYYRTGYQAEQYVNESAWNARTLMECSLAIKCPSIDVHLATFKKF
jgi:glutathione synthase